MRILDWMFFDVPFKKCFGSRGFAAFLFLAAFSLTNPLPSFAAVSVTVAPASVNLSPGGTQQFTATVTGAVDTSVTWSVQQGTSGGTILASGLYTAPSAAGSYSVVATSNADGTQSASAVVSVAGFLHTGLINVQPMSATLLADGTILYTKGGSSVAEVYDPATSTSTATGPMTILRVDYTATLLQTGKVLIAGGQSSGQTTAAAELYDPVAKTFNPTGSLSAPREGHTATLLPDGRVLIVGGGKGNCTSNCSYTTAEIYDPAAGAFSIAPGSLPVAPFIPTTSPVGYAASILLNTGKVLIAGGGIGGTAELFDPTTGQFSPTGALVNQNDGFSATLLPSGKVLFVAAGKSEAASSTAEIYDPALGTFAATGSLNVARTFETATLLTDGEVLIVGGWATAPAELFDPATGKFMVTGSLQEARISQFATLVADGTVVVAGGVAPFNGLSSVEVYDPTAKTFSSKSTFMRGVRADQASARLADGRLLMTGGVDAALNVLNSAEIFDPSTGVFTLTGPMVQARHGHTATLLNNGTVLIVGGYSDDVGTQGGTLTVSTAEIFDPVTGTFRLTSSPTLARVYHTATLLPNGTVLVAGGATAGNSQTPTSTVEIYDPVAGTFTAGPNMAGMRYYHAATSMNDGRVLISDGLAQGGTPGNGIGLEEIYDPNTAEFTQAGPREVFNSEIPKPTASILLQNGEVLADAFSVFDPTTNSVTMPPALEPIAEQLQTYEFASLPGGHVFTQGGTNGNYIFDPNAQTYTQTENQQYSRTRPTLYVLPNNEVMVAGGAAVAQVEFYVPAAANSNPGPSLSSMNPSTVVMGSAAFTLLVTGSNFLNNSVVNYNGAARQTTFIGATQLSISVLASDIANAGTATITVTNPAGGSAGVTTSNPLTLTILAANIQPVVGALSPASATAGGPAFALTLSGSGFTQNSIVTFNGASVPATFISLAQLQANIPSSAIVTAGSFLVAVANPGGSPTTVVSFTVNNPAPQENLLSPGSAAAGSAAETLSVTGINFNASSRVLINGAARTTTFVSSTLLQTGLSANDLQQGTTLTVSVSNPSPGGGTTSTLPFTVSDYSVAVPTPSVTVDAGQTAVFNLTVAPSNGSFANPITFTVAPLPTGATATFSPSAAITPGATSQTVTLSISTTAHTVSSAPNSKPFDGPMILILSFAGLGFAVTRLIWTARGRAALSATQLATRVMLMLLLLGVASMIACSGGGGGSSSSVPQVNTATGTPAGSYTITVTATSGGVAHSASATITVI